ncbi:hypothetical protein Ptr902_05441 [Pyrenophora tritici-repentis]|nr:hypothetical protein Ptr902_05441 [Pyrenophora tritici-repentis]
MKASTATLLLTLLTVSLAHAQHLRKTVRSTPTCWTAGGYQPFSVKALCSECDKRSTYEERFVDRCGPGTKAHWGHAACTTEKDLDGHEGHWCTLYYKCC